MVVDTEINQVKSEISYLPKTFLSILDQKLERPFYYQLMCLKLLDATVAGSDLVSHYVLRPVCPNI